MDKTYRIETRRMFLLESLPEPLTRASSHLQIFDNYIVDTRLRLRSIRRPETREWTHVLQQRFPAAENDLSCIRIGEIYLNEFEYEHFKIFEGNEIRKNRYFHEFDGRMCAFDLYLGALWGLTTAITEFEGVDGAKVYDAPRFALFEVTGNPFFDGSSLVEKKFEEIRQEVARLEPLVKSIEDKNID